MIFYIITKQEKSNFWNEDIIIKGTRQSDLLKHFWGEFIAKKRIKIKTCLLTKHLLGS